MAIATLAACYNNPHVFEGVVKIRKGQAVTLMVQSTSMESLRSIMAQFTTEVSFCSCDYSWLCVGLMHDRHSSPHVQLSTKIDPCDPSAEKTRATVEEVLRLCHTPSSSSSSSVPWKVAGFAAVVAFSFAWYSYLSAT